MSARHRDALAHLLYGVGAGGGFILLTGEVGTGKTTINRALMQQLPDDTDIAVILNPALNADELLATVCDELHIDYDRDSYTLKSLTDLLHSYLLDNHSSGRNTVLLIDEAQHLQFDVLEQIRLLTNLETNTRKLLQIVLVGQPELSEILSRPELRQLNQRITARFELQPLNREETDAYIRHRLQVAGLPASQDLFPSRVVGEIHRLTGGIPRVTNVLCDRVLLGAYGHNRSNIDMKILRQAAGEVFGTSAQRDSAVGQKLALAAALVLGIAIAAGVYLRLNPADSRIASTAVTRAQPATPTPVIDPAPEAQALVQSVVPRNEGVIQADVGSNSIAAVPAEPEETESIPAVALVREPALATREPASAADPTRDAPYYQRRWQALSQLARYVGGAPLGDCQALSGAGLRCEEMSVSTWDELLAYNQPAVLSLVTPERFASHAVLLGVSGDRALLLFDNLEYPVSLAELGTLWKGDFMFLWQPPDGYTAPLKRGARGPMVSWLAGIFAELDGQATPLATNYFNDDLDQRVRLFQRQYQLRDDGVVGVRTLLKLQESQGGAQTLLRRQAAMQPQGLR